MERDTIDLGTMNIPTLFRKFFIPTLLGMLAMSAVTTVDGIFVGHGVGSDGIAAVNLSIPLLMVFTGLGLMVGVGCSVVASVHLAKGKPVAARINITQALAFVTVITLVPSAVIVVFAEKTAYLLGSSEHLLPMVTDYLVWFIPCLTIEMWIAVALFILRLDGVPRLAMWCSLLSGGINVVLDWWFIFPLGWGVKGAALASSISVTVGGVVVIGYLAGFARTLRLYPLKWSRKSLRLSCRNIGYQCRIGSSALLGEITLALLMFAGNQVFMHYLGDQGVGAFGVACYYLPFIFMIGNAVSQSAQPIISFNFGAGKPDRVAQAEKTAIATALLCSLFVTSVFFFFPGMLVGLFIDPVTASGRIATEGFPFFALGFVFFVLNLTVIGYCQSIGRVVPAVVFAALRGIVFLTAAFLCLPKLLGTPGIWLAMPVSEGLTCLVIAGYYSLSGSRRSIGGNQKENRRRGK